MLDARSNTPLFRFIRPKKVRSSKLALRPFFIISLAFIFLLNSIGGGLFVGESWAVKNLSGLTSVGPEKTGGPTPLKSLNPDTFTLPQELGYIQESTKVLNSTKTVIHIQDAHCNYAAQKSISEILNYLTKEYGVNMVNCEGGAKGYDLSVFTDIPEKDIREKTSDFFVKEGVLSAAEFFAVNNPKEVKLWGVEDADLYIKNLKIYRDSLSHKEEVDRYIKSIGYILDNLKRHVYSGEILEFDDYYTRYKAGKITFKEYMKYLIMMAQKKLIDIKSFSDIYLLSQTLEQEEKIDFKKANNEKDEVVDRLKKVLSRNELEELIKKVGQLKVERISQADFYAYLIKKAKSIKIDLTPYPELQKYVIYVSLYNAVDKTKVTKEIGSLEDKIKESLYENDTQRELGILSKNLVLTNNMFNISLTREDYAYYVEHEAAFSVSNYEKFIEKEAPLYKIRATLDENVASLDIYREGMEKFYQCSLERDKAFIKNIKFTDHDRPNSIIITGGFHTQNLRELFKDENVSYISIMPKFTNPPGYESPYLKRLAGQRTALENVIDAAIPAALNLAVVEILSTKLAIQVEGPANLEKIRLEIAIVSAILRGKEFILKIAKGVPVKGTKPEEERFVTFAKAEGAEGITHSIATSIPQGTAFNAILKGLSINTFNFELTPQARLAQQPQQVAKTPTAGKEAPATKPFAKVTEKGEAQPIASGAQVLPGAKIPTAESIYESARNMVPEIAHVLRRGSPTYLISPTASEEDIAPTTSNNRIAEQILGKQGHEVTAKSYLAKGDWVESLKKLLDRTLPAFERDLSNPKTRMAIRFMPDTEGKIVKDIRSVIQKFLESKQYTPEQIDMILDKQVHFVPISIQNVEHLNSSIDLFTDLGMMEIDRYIKGDYPSEELPPELKDRFLALLKLSITNYDDLMKLVKTEEDIRGILDAIFKINILLRIRPVDWKSIDEWKKAQDAVLKAL